MDPERHDLLGSAPPPGEPEAHAAVAPAAPAPAIAPSGRPLDSPWKVLSLTAVIFLTSQIIVAAGFIISRDLARTFAGSVGAIHRRFVSADVDPNVILAVIGGSALLPLVFVLAAARMSGRPWRERLGLVRARIRPADYSTVVVGTFAAAALGVVLARGLELVHIVAPLVRPDSWFIDALMRGTPGTRIGLIVIGSVLVAIEEEALFRGYLQRGLSERWDPALAVGVTAVLFAAIHISPAHVVVVLPISIGQCWLAWRTRSILPTIVSHAGLNGTACAMTLAYGVAATDPTSASAGFGLSSHPFLQWAPPTLAAAGATLWLAWWRIERGASEREDGGRPRPC